MASDEAFETRLAAAVPSVVAFDDASDEALADSPVALLLGFDEFSQVDSVAPEVALAEFAVTSLALVVALVVASVVGLVEWS